MNFDGVEFGSVLFSLLIVHNYTPWLISSFSMYCCCTFRQDRVSSHNCRELGADAVNRESLIRREASGEGLPAHGCDRRAWAAGGGHWLQLRLFRVLYVQ